MDHKPKPTEFNIPCCSKSLPRNRFEHNKNNSNNVIVIDDNDSFDSDYETGSSLSRSSSLSSPTSDAVEAKHDTKKPMKLLFYANVDYSTGAIRPWQKVFYKEQNQATKGKIKYQVENDTIVLSDSDNDDDDIINLDSDEESDPVKFHWVECVDGRVMKIPDQYIANGCHPGPDRLALQTRIIARRSIDQFPLAYDDDHGNVRFLYKNDDKAFYAGVISDHQYVEKGMRYYLVFFDDGHAQYVAHKHIRVVFGNYGTKYVHANAQKFYDYYFTNLREDKVREIASEKDRTIRVFLNGKFECGKVLGYDPNKPALIKIHFFQSNTVEILYAGSPRIEIIWKEVVKDKNLKKYNDANATMIEVSSDSEEEEEYQSPKKKPFSDATKDAYQKTFVLRPSLLIENFKPGKRLSKHTCNQKCVEEYEQNKKIFTYDPLKRPLLAGWQRKINLSCFYVAPCGRVFKTMSATCKYLKTTKSKLTIDCFAFSANIKCLTEVRSYSENGKKYLNDIIKGGQLEKRRIPVVSISDNLPHFNEYVTQYRRNPRSKKVPAILDEADTPFRSCCDCTDDCSDKSKCSCWQLTLTNSNFGYKYKRLESKVYTGIFECNPGCKCSSSCSNRVVKSKIEQKLELYETKDRGYGIRCITDIPKGAFISCYFGDLLHGKTADERAMKKVGLAHGDEYFMQLDYIEMNEQYKDDYESDVEFDSDDEAVPKRPRLDESMKRTKPSRPPYEQKPRDYIEFFPESILKNRAPTEVNQRTILFGEKSDEFVVDGRYRGNISRFYNHSCEPNLFSQTVFVDTHDIRFPWIAFFAADDIKAGTELTWDYSYAIGSIVGREMQCKCGSTKCRKRLL